MLPGIATVWLVSVVGILRWWLISRPNRPAMMRSGHAVRMRLLMYEIMLQLKGAPAYGGARWFLTTSFERFGQQFEPDW